uniref:NACHT domain-containing protein n=2 Tax=Cyprinus carpio carpio TaxID=630221 RepID=A0A9J8AAW2_CYPCA
MNLQYRTLLNDRSKFAAMDKLLSDERLDLAACSTEPVIIQRSKEQTKKYYGEWVRSVRTFGKQTPSPLLLNDENHSIRIDQLFSPDSDGNTPKTVILSGDSGRGKSFMLQKIMLDWASGELYSENFDAVFLLKCEEFKSISTEESLFYLLSLNHSLTSKQISKILQLTPEKVLILIDGMDEYVSRPRIHFMQHTNLYTKAPVMVILTNLLRRVLLPESFMLVTTRSAVDTVNLLKDPQRFTEIMGFSERGVQEYFQKFFQDEQLFRKMYERVKINESLLTACSVPLLCWMVCFCLKKHFTDDDHVMRELKTNTSIYVHFVSTLLEHHDQSQSVLTMLRSLGQLAEEGMKKQQVFFVGKSVTMKCFDAVTTLFLYKDGLKIKDSQKPAFRFMHHSFQEFFTALYYVLLDEENSWWKVSELLDWMEWGDIIDRPSPERRSNPIPSVMLFLCGLLNKKVSSSLFKKIQWTVPHTVKLKEKLQESVLRLTTHSGCELYALHCLYELQDERFVSEALKKHNFMDLSNISLTSTDCWVLLYCLQCCPHVRYLNLMYCDLTAEKLKILQPALCMSKTMRLSVEHLSEVADLIQILGESKILRQLKVQEDENSAESPRWSLNLSITRGDVLLSLSSSEKSPSFPAVLNITLTCPQSEISSTDWSLFLQRLSKTGKVAEDSSALDEHVSLLLSSFHSVGLKTLDLKLVSLNESWASGIICLVQTCTSLQQLNVCADLLLEEGIMLLNKSLTDPHCTVIIEGSESSKHTDQCKELDCSHSCYDKVKIHFKPKVLEQLKKLNISEPEPSVMNLYCQSCVHIGDSDQWVQVEPLACTDEGGSEFRISTPAGRFECSRTRMRWVCAGDITLQYRAVDGGFLSEELERLQCERIGPVIDVTVISGKLEEAHLPHYACLAESYSSLKYAVKVLGILESVELTCFHAKILQPSFWPTTVIKEKDIPVEQHLDLLIFMTSEDPLILHVYFIPLFDTFSKEKIKQEETAYNPHVLEIEHPSPSMKIQMDTPHVLKVSGASVDSKEGITFLSSIHPVFFKIKQDIDGDVQMTLIKQQHEMFVWKTIIWKDKLNQKKQEMRDLMARFGRLSTEMRKHKKRKPRKGWSDIILYYKASVIDKCKFVTECNLPTDECVELAGRYTEPVIIQRSKEQNEKYYHEHVRSAHASGLNTSSHLLSNDKNRSIRIDQLFSPDCDGNTPKTVILSGDSGRGKSFTLQKIMLDWAFGKLYYKNFDVIFLLKCEELKCISEEMSLFELLSWSCSLTLDQISQILELTPEKVLILIDGIDEYVSHPPSHSMLVLTNPSDRAQPMDIFRNVLKGILLPESFMLVTTISLAADAEINLLKGPQRFTEIVGFSERGVQEYFQKFFWDEQLFRKTYERVKINESLLTACSVPLLCWMVCFCLKKHFTDDDHVMRELKTTTSIYVYFVSTLLEHHDQSQSVLTMLRSLGQRAEEGVKKREGLFVEKSVTATGLDPATNVFLYKDSLKRNNRQVQVFKFMHLSFQEFFTALYYVLLDKEESWGKVTDLLTSLKMKGIINRPSPERRSNPIPSVMMFLCGLLNEKASNSLFEMIKWTVPQIINLKTNMQGSLLTVIRHNGCELFALRCLFELQDEKVVRRALGDWVSMNLHNVPLRSKDCWVLLYCLQCCPHVRYLNLMYCDSTAEKLKILQPALCMCENMRLSVKHLSEVGDLIQILGKSKFLKKMRVQESENSAESPRWSLDLSVTHGDVLLSLSSSEKNPSFPAVLNITLTCPQSEISSTDWSLFLQRLSKTEKVAEDSSALDEHVSLLLSLFHSVGLKTLNLKLVSLNKSWASGIIFLAQTCTSLQQLSVSVTGLLLEEGLMFLKKSLTEPHCTVIIEGRKCSKLTDQCKEQDWSHSCNEKVEIHLKPKVLKKLEEPTISDSEPSGLNLQPLPVCQFCVHIGDSDQWVQVEPSVCTDEGGSEFRISTPAGRFECSRTRMRWVCAGDVTLQYRAVDGGFLSEELERLQCERIGPVIDVTVISGKLEEAQLPHYACLAESDPSLTRSVKVLSVEDEGISLESVELTRFHAKILKPSFSPKTVLMKLGISVKVHCDLLIFMIQKSPIILHVYFFPSDSLFKEKIKTEEKQSHPIKCSRPETPLRMMKQHSLEVPGASVQPKAIKLRGDIEPNFFQVKHPVVNDIKMSLSRVDDQKSVWTATVWKELTNMHPNRAETLFQTGQNQNTPQSAVNFDKVQFFDRNWCALIKSVENVNNIADNLLQKQIIHEELYSEITHPASTSEASMRKICSIVRKGSDTVKEMFISILLEEDPNLLNHLPLPDS